MKPKSRSQRERERFKILSSRRYPKFFESDKKESMIIIGCGDGPQIPIFSPHVKSILAVDVDRERVGLTDELINQKNIRNCESRQLSIYDVKNLSTKFDTAVLIDIIEHLGNPKKALLSVRKSLRPKGRVLITFPMMFEIYYSSGRMLNRYILKIPEKKGKKYDYHQIKMLPYSWFRLFKEAGFRIRKTNATTMFPPLDWFGVKPVWYSDEVLNAIDSFVCSIPLIKYLGLSMMVVLEKTKD